MSELLGEASVCVCVCVCVCVLIYLLLEYVHLSPCVLFDLLQN